MLSSLSKTLFSHEKSALQPGALFLYVKIKKGGTEWKLLILMLTN
nr:MAG TPA: hypothetical protein [Caudoviricetes sp.]